ncbi:hypothetical protein XELAEV_18001713mg [Xenopus laevis]|nr:hypothetical protein XELAEV_18001713mg [Xenopus laevis]
MTGLYLRCRFRPSMRIGVLGPPPKWPLWIRSSLCDDYRVSGGGLSPVVSRSLVVEELSAVFHCALIVVWQQVGACCMHGIGTVPFQNGHRRLVASPMCRSETSLCW